jgi:hypothetical protein
MGDPWQGSRGLRSDNRPLTEIDPVRIRVPKPAPRNPRPDPIQKPLPVHPPRPPHVVGGSGCKGTEEEGGHCQWTKVLGSSGSGLGGQLRGEELGTVSTQSGARPKTNALLAGPSIRRSMDRQRSRRHASHQWEAQSQLGRCARYCSGRKGRRAGCEGSLRCDLPARIFFRCFLNGAGYR